MEVKILSITQNPLEVMYTAARTCYSSQAPQQISNGYKVKINMDKMATESNAMKLLNKVLGSGHESVAEHCYVTFAVSGISRAIANQLVRHRHCSFSQKSTRYCKIKNNKESILGYIELAKNGNPFLLQDLCSTYFVCDLNNTDLLINYANQLITYLDLTESGVKAEDARDVLPLALKTDLVVSMNFRELIHVCNLRLCTRAQKPIRELVNEMTKLVVVEVPFMKPYLVPKCETIGFCTEENCCNRKPKLTEIDLKKENK